MFQWEINFYGQKIIFVYSDEEMLKRILVVEDDSILRENITIMLEQEYSVVEADDGSKAIGILEQDYKFDLILSDIMMPNVDGYQLYNFTKSSEILSEIPFIFLTARADNSSVRKGMNLGIDDYITKPFLIDDMLNGIKTRLIKKDKTTKKLDDLKKSISLYLPHELRTPLVSILGNSELISDYYDDLSKSEILELTEAINHSGKRLKYNIEKFLIYADLTTQKAGNFSDKTNDVVFYSNKHNCKSALIDNYHCLQRMDDILLNFSDSNLEITQSDFEILIVELVSNACKFSEKKAPIVVTGKVLNNEYIVTIRDNGRGIEKENIKKIDSFVQFNRSYYQQDGNGIGLAMVKLICEKYNIKFSIESEINKFTIVTLTFPLNETSQKTI